MRTKILKRMKVNVYAVRNPAYSVPDAVLADCQRSINTYLTKGGNNYHGILNVEKRGDMLMVYAVGSKRDCWLLANAKYQGVQEVGTADAIIIAIIGKNTLRHVFAADCSV